METMSGVMPVYNLADNNYRGCNYGFGNGTGDWIWILVFFALFGYGGNGF